MVGRAVYLPPGGVTPPGRWRGARCSVILGAGLDRPLSRRGRIVARGFPLSDPAELLQLAAEAALIRATRKDPRRDRRNHANRLEFLGEAGARAGVLERCGRPATQDPVAELRGEPSGSLGLDDLRWATHRPEVDDIGRIGAPRSGIAGPGIASSSPVSSSRSAVRPRTCVRDRHGETRAPVCPEMGQLRGHARLGTIATQS
jgi:hypothetical protein